MSILGSKGYSNSMGTSSWLQSQPPWLWWVVAGCTLLVIGAVVSRMIWQRKVGWKRPRNNLNWVDDCAELPHFEMAEDGNAFTLKNMRNFTWRTTKDKDIDWGDFTASIDDLVHIWFILDHFHSIKGMAHTMITFEFKDGRFITASFEARRQKGERYHPWTGLWREFELYLAWADERDLLGLRTNARGNDVYLFETEALPHKREGMLRKMIERTNELHDHPEFYNTLGKTCSTSIIREINRVTPGRVPFSWRALFPGHIDRLALKRGLLKDKGGLEATKAAAAVTEKAVIVGLGEKDTNHFSVGIRKKNDD
ncbi:MAG: hypothetical protein CXT68_02855 [Methanobacteriota archaeon]|nr:MAG: hypothetical protein CXT68_02855 [Euryarchaeota archaeon]